MATRRSDLTPQFTFDESTGQYRRADGRFVPRTTVRSVLDKYLDAKTKEVTQLAEQFRNREITFQQWQKQTEAHIAKIHLANAAAAKGGWEKLDSADFGRVGSLVKFEYQQFRKLADQIDKGLPLDGRFMQRMAQYAQSGRHTYHVIDRREQKARGLDEERSILHARDSCVGCLSAAARGWQPIDTLPLPGERNCGRNCKCTIEYRRGHGRKIEEEENSEKLPTHAPLPDYLTDVPEGKTAPLSRRIKINPPQFKKTKDAQKWIEEQGVEAARFSGNETVSRVLVEVVAEMKAAGFPLPEQIKVEPGMFTGRDALETPAMMFNNRLFINPNWSHWSNLNQLTERTKRNFKSGIWSSGSYRHIMRHELGHNIWNSPGLTRPAQAAERIKQFESVKRHFEGRISERALLDVDEFVSEVFAALMNGEKIDNRVLAYYRAIGGPEPFKDNG